MPNRCVECSTNFCSLQSFRRHAKKFHAEKVSTLAPLQRKSSVNSNIRCKYCQKPFNHKQSLHRHIVQSHGIVTSKREITEVVNKKNCPLCDHVASLKTELLEHFEHEHEIDLHWNYFVFSSFQEFNKWKVEISNKTNTKFIKKRIENYQSHKSIQYACHRSGNYLPEGKGLRHLKAKGSCKINAYCPASMKVILEKGGSVTVDYLETHVGHDIDIGHLQLTESERRKIAAQIADNIPFDEILNNIHNSITDSKTLKRIHLITKKDLFNIQSSHLAKNMDSSELVPSETESEEQDPDEPEDVEMEPEEVETLYIEYAESEEPDMNNIPPRIKQESMLANQNIKPTIKQEPLLSTEDIEHKNILMEIEKILASAKSPRTKIDKIRIVVNSVPPTLVAIDTNIRKPSMNNLDKHNRKKSK